MRIRLLVGFFLLNATSFNSLAAITHLDPRPYHSSADSPFPIQGQEVRFWLEDFEDGALNTPGIAQPETIIKGLIMEPSQATDSVDSDDGNEDGFGRLGYSLASNLIFSGGTGGTFSQIELMFTPNDGLLPVAFGVVLTDGPEDAEFLLIVEFPIGADIFLPASNIFLDSDRDGVTEEDRFIGFLSDEPFSRVTIQARTPGAWIGAGFEIDHVQYGTAIPEPSTVVLLLGGMLFLASKMHSRCRLCLVGNQFFECCGVDD